MSLISLEFGKWVQAMPLAFSLRFMSGLAESIHLWSEALLTQPSLWGLKASVPPPTPCHPESSASLLLLARKSPQLSCDSTIYTTHIFSRQSLYQNSPIKASVCSLFCWNPDDWYTKYIFQFIWKFKKQTVLKCSTWTPFSWKWALQKHHILKT